MLRLLRSFFSTVRFFRAQLSTAAVPAVPRREVFVRAARLHLRTHVYSTKDPKASTIVFVHGMSPLGIDDPRQIRAASALSAAGFRVLCPEFPEIRNLRIENESCNKLDSFLVSVVAQPELCPRGRVALFAPSFSGAICLVVAARAHLQKCISAICCVGSFARIDRPLRHILAQEEGDPYSWLIAFANFLPRIKKDKKLAEYFFAAAFDNWTETAAHSPHFSHIQPQDTRSRLLRRLAKKDQALVARIAKEPKLRRELGEKMLQKIPEILTAYDVTRVATHIRAPVLLLHGAGDAVVPEQESRELYPLLPNARLVVSPLLEHADPKISLRLVREVWRLVSAMAWYFRHADR